MSRQIFSGTGVAIITPFREDESIDFKSLEKLLEHCIGKGVDYIVALGTTGESVTLSKDERHAVINFVVDVVNKRVPIVAGLGGNCTSEVISSVKSWNFEGINAVLSVAPYYNKPSQRGLFQHFKSIADVCPVPMIIYNVPGRTSSNISGETTVKLAREVKNIIAIKEASGDISQIMYIIRNKPADFLVISGDDVLTLPMIAVGGAGVISVIANAYPKEYSEMVKFALEGNMKKALELHYLLIEMIWAIFAEGSPPGIKAALSILGIAGNHLRLPLVPVSGELYKRIAALTKKI